jgi:hypothetical protein
MMALGIKFSNIIDMEYFQQDKKLRMVCKALVYEFIFDDEANFRKFMRMLNMVSFNNVQEQKVKPAKKFYIDTKPNKDE